MGRDITTVTKLWAQMFNIYIEKKKYTHTHTHRMEISVTAFFYKNNTF